MSKIFDLAFKAVGKSQFNFIDNHTLEIQDAFIFWTNFRGEANKYGNKARTFNLAINSEVAEELNKTGWKVRELTNEEGDKLFFVNIKVNMDSQYPPIVALFSTFRGKRSKRMLDIETIGELDRIDIERCDITVNSYQSKAFPDKVSGYAKKIYVIQKEHTEFGGVYDDWLDDDERAAIIEEVNANPSADNHCSDSDCPF